jgi:cell division septation protein DedD
MKNKETGEFELVVGDKQLLSGFFLGVVLLAVVFALGYVLGRSSPKSATVPTDTVASAPNSTPDNRPQAAAPVVPPSPEPAATTPPTGDSPAQTAAATPQEPEPHPATVPAKEAGAPSPAPSAAAPDPANASYWQVAAASHNSADAFFQTLKDKGFPVTTRPGPNNLTLVLVGPYYDKASLTKAKKQLEDAGFNTYYKKQ